MTFCLTAEMMILLAAKKSVKPKLSFQLLFMEEVWTSGSKFNLKESQQENYISDVNGTLWNKNPSMFIHTVTLFMYNLRSHKFLFSQSNNLLCL